MDEFTELKQITTTLLDEESEHYELLEATKALTAFFEKFSSVSTRTAHYECEDASHTYLESGVAISPLDAAICTHEYLRTCKYLKGVQEAIKDLLSKHDEIHVLYAGCGPYATLILPLLPFFDVNRLKVSFLDIHQVSLDSVQSIMAALGLAPFAEDFLLEDATSYQVTQTTHLMITETMKAAFENEPQVAITLNLQPQLANGGVFIPQRVVVGFELAKTVNKFKNNEIHRIREREEICLVMDVNALKKLRRDSIISTPICQLSESIDQSKEPYLFTDIYVYKDIFLTESQCSLNLPKKLPFSLELAKGKTVHFDYSFTSTPQIKLKLI